MDPKEAATEEKNDASKKHFRRELDKWFRERGVVADLRSHLRHSMIMALQRVDAVPKLREDGSPKAHAVNLLVAEFLLKRGCHYTLSVFTSEVPTLAGLPVSGRMFGNRKKEPSKTAHLKNTFQSNEVDEIVNALGWSCSTKSFERLRTTYLDAASADSLLELLLRWTHQLSNKLDLQRNLRASTGRRDRISLSSEWTSDVADILLNEEIPPSRVASIQRSIFRVTEAEVRRATDEERRKNLSLLEGREKRIQNWLDSCERNVREQLVEAEKELIRRKDSIEEDLAERHRHLSQMVLEWNSKHEHIVQLAKNFYDMRNENKALRDVVRRLKKENDVIKGRERQEEELNSRAAGRQVPRDGIDAVDASTGGFRKGIGEIFSFGDHVELLGSSRGSQETNRKNDEIQGVRQCKDDNGVDFAGSGTPDDAVILSARRAVRKLEEKSLFINQMYMTYKSRYAAGLLAAESDLSTDPSTEPTSTSPSLMKTRTFPLRENPGPGSSATKFSQTDDRVEIFQKVDQRNSDKFRVGSAVGKPQKARQEPATHTSNIPTKRQLKNREYFLKARQLLEELEGGNEEKSGGSASSNLSALARDGAVDGDPVPRACERQDGPATGAGDSRNACTNGEYTQKQG